MEGIITIQDKRENLNAMQQYRKYEAEKIVKSVNGESLIDTIIDGIKTIVSVAGMVLTVITKFFPGKLDDIAVILAQPAILNAIESARGVLKGVFISKDNGKINAALADFNGNVKNITIKDTNLVDTVKDKAAVKIQQVGTNIKNNITERMVK